MTTPTDEGMDDIDRRATELLFTMLGGEFVVHGPADAIRAAMQRLTTPGAARAQAQDYFRVAGDWESDEFDGLADFDPTEVEDAWIGAAASVVAPYVVPEVEPLPADALDHVDWLTIAVWFHRAGPGAVVDTASLIEALEVDDSTGPEARAELEAALIVVCELWRALGVIDDNDRMTPLGSWGLPVSLLDAWESPSEDDDEG